MVISHKWQHFGRSELEFKRVFWHRLGEEITSLTSPRGVILLGGAFRQHLQTRPVQLDAEWQTCFTGSAFRQSEGGSHVKVPGQRNQRKETASRGYRASLMGFSQTGEPRFASPQSLCGEATFLSHCASSVSPISWVNQWPR